MSLLETSSSAGAGLFGLFGLILIVVGFGVYFVPTIIAFTRNKSNKVAILALNFLLGWSLIGWVISLVWALSQEQKQTIVQQNFHPGTYVPSSTGTNLGDSRNES